MQATKWINDFKIFPSKFKCQTLFKISVKLYSLRFHSLVSRRLGDPYGRLGD